MKITTRYASALLAGTLAASAMAEETPKADGWVGLFGEYYWVDDDKPEGLGTLDKGPGVGLEFGLHFSEQWAGRIEWSHLNIDGENGGSDESGDRVGVDALYFFKPNGNVYAFAGLKNENLDQTYRLANVGLGTHMMLAPQWRLMLEGALYHDFGEGFKDYSVKLGIARVFGADSPAAPKPAPVVAKASDSDNDGVMDAQDACPDSAAGARVNANGCSDSDNDGVIDGQDLCPNSMPGSVVNEMGCADDDNDGVANNLDKCPATPMEDKVDADGCSIFQEESLSVTLNVLFANNSSIIGNKTDPQFADFAAFMRRFPNTQAEIAGHTSAVGSAEYNQMLSDKRAKAVRQLLIDQYGIAADRLTAKGYGETRLLDSADTAEAHRKNRRIEAQITVKQQTELKR